MHNYERHVTYREVGHELSKDWGQTICGSTEFSWTERDDALKKAIHKFDPATQTKCLLAYIASKTSDTVSNEQFRRVYTFNKWIETEFKAFIDTRESKHGKCPVGIKGSLRTSISNEVGDWTRLYKQVELGEIQFIDGVPYYYGQIEPNWSLKNLLKHCVRRMNSKVKIKYDKWMKTSRKALK